MPAIQKVQTLSAAQRGYNPLSDWQYQYAPFNGLVRIGCTTTAGANGVQIAVFTGSDNVVERSPISGGATGGVIPGPIDVPFFEFLVRQGDRITVQIDELGAATPIVNFFCAIDPV